jgi:hypothetical protein
MNSRSRTDDDYNLREYQRSSVKDPKSLMPRLSLLTLLFASLLTNGYFIYITVMTGPPSHSPAEAIDLPEVVAEVKAAFDRYKEAGNSGNIAILNSTFRNDLRTIRYGRAENLYGYKEIEGFRAAARLLDPPRTFSKTVITTYGRDFAVVSTLTYRANEPGRVGRQMQTWVRFPEGWRVVAAHLSAIDEPK